MHGRGCCGTKILNKINDYSPQFCLQTLNGHFYRALPRGLTIQQKNKMEELLNQAQFITGKIAPLMSRSLPAWCQSQAVQKIHFLKAIAPYVTLMPELLERFSSQFVLIQLRKWVSFPGTVKAFFYELSNKLTPNIYHYVHALITRLQRLRRAILHEEGLLELSFNDFTLSIEETAFVHSYVISLQWLAYCAKKDLSDAVHFICSIQKSILNIRIIIFLSMPIQH